MFLNNLSLFSFLKMYFEIFVSICYLCFRNCTVFYLGFDDGKEDHQLRMYAVQSYLALLEEEDKLYPQKFLQVMSWVRSEFHTQI